MTMITRVLLLLTAIAYVALAQNSLGRCLCTQVNTVKPPSRRYIVDVQIHPADNFCPKVEVIITLQRGSDIVMYCLDPKPKMIQRLMTTVMKKKALPPLVQTTTKATSTSGIPESQLPLTR